MKRWEEEQLARCQVADGQRSGKITIITQRKDLNKKTQGYAKMCNTNTNGL